MSNAMCAALNEEKNISVILAHPERSIQNLLREKEGTHHTHTHTHKWNGFFLLYVCCAILHAVLTVVIGADAKRTAHFSTANEFLLCALHLTIQARTRMHNYCFFKRISKFLFSNQRKKEKVALFKNFYR